MADDIAEQLIGTEDRSSCCGDTDPIDCPVGTVLVDPKTGKWAVRFDRGDNTGKGQHVWLSPAGVVHAEARFLHHVEVRGWEVAEARRWGRVVDDEPPVNGDLRARCISALSGMVSEFISPDEFGGYDIHYAELVDIVLAEVQPVLERQAAELADLRVSREVWAIEAMGLDGLADRFLVLYTRLAEAVAKRTGKPVSTGIDDLLAALEGGDCHHARELERLKPRYRAVYDGREHARGELERISKLIGVDEDDFRGSAVAGEVERYIDQVKLVTDRQNQYARDLDRLAAAVNRSLGVAPFTSVDGLIEALKSRPAIPADASPRPAMIRAIADQLGRIAASQEMPFRQQIQDASDALAGRQGDPGSPWDQWLAPAQEGQEHG